MYIKELFALCEKFFVNVDELKKMNENDIRAKVDKIQNSGDFQYLLSMLQDKKPYCFITGFPGSGKSYTTEEISKRENKDSVETDAVVKEIRKNSDHPIVKEFYNDSYFNEAVQFLNKNGKTVKDSFSNYFKEFRTFELICIIDSFLNGKFADKVVDTGGGVFTQPLVIAVAKALEIPVENIEIEKEQRADQITYDYLIKGTRDNYGKYAKEFIERKNKFDNLDNRLSNMIETFKNFVKESNFKKGKSRTEILNEFINANEEFSELLATFKEGIVEKDSKEQYRAPFYTVATKSLCK